MVRSVRVWLVARCMLFPCTRLMVTCCVWGSESFIWWVVDVGVGVRLVNGNRRIYFKIASCLWGF